MKNEERRMKNDDFIMYIEHADKLVTGYAPPILSIFGPLVAGNIPNEQWGYVLLGATDVKKIRVKHATLIDPWDYERHVFNFVIDFPADVPPSKIDLAPLNGKFFVARAERRAKIFETQIQIADKIDVKWEKHYPALISVGEDKFYGVYSLKKQAYRSQSHSGIVKVVMNEERDIQPGEIVQVEWRGKKIGRGQVKRCVKVWK